MAYNRQNRILEIIKEQEVETQQQLADILNSEGFEVTQATVSRDIKKLNLIKQPRNGKSCYKATPTPEETSNSKFRKIMKDIIVSVDSSENMIVIKTLPGCAGPASEAIDMQNDSNILGTIAGENTIFVVVRSKDLVQSVIDEIKKVLA